MIALYYGLCVSTDQLLMHAMYAGIRRELGQARGEVGWQEFLDYMANQVAEHIEGKKRCEERRKAGEPQVMSDPDDPEWIKFQELHRHSLQFEMWLPNWMDDAVRRGWPVRCDEPVGKWNPREDGDTVPGTAALEYANKIAASSSLEHIRLEGVDPSLHFLVTKLPWKNAAGATASGSNAAQKPWLRSLGQSVFTSTPGNLELEYSPATKAGADSLAELASQWATAFQIQKWRTVFKHNAWYEFDRPACDDPMPVI